MARLTNSKAYNGALNQLRSIVANLQVLCSQAPPAPRKRGARSSLCRAIDIACGIDEWHLREELSLRPQLTARWSPRRGRPFWPRMILMSARMPGCP